MFKTCVVFQISLDLDVLPIHVHVFQISLDIDFLPIHVHVFQISLDIDFLPILIGQDNKGVHKECRTI